RLFGVDEELRSQRAGSGTPLVGQLPCAALDRGSIVVVEMPHKGVPASRQPSLVGLALVRRRSGAGAEAFLRDVSTRRRVLPDDRQCRVRVGVAMEAEVRAETGRRAGDGKGRRDGRNENDQTLDHWLPPLSS